jgi:acyl transferase domain-containing protein
MGSPLPVAVLFPGQGAQHPRMAAGLYRHCDVFTDTMDEAFELLGDNGESLREQWLTAEPSPCFDDVTVAQPLLYAVGCALGREILSWGVEPAALLGHSVGELVAATVAGVVRFTDGMRLIRARMREFASVPAGGMLAVAASAEEVQPFLGDLVSIAAVNAPRQLLLAGRTEPLGETERTLNAHGLVCVAVRAKQPFHSPEVEPASTSSGRLWTDAVLEPPNFPLYSAYTQGRLTAEQACDHAFWVAQPAQTVFFASTLDTLLADGDQLLVEAGPSAGLSTLVRRHPAVLSGRSAVVPLLPERLRGDEWDRRTAREAADRIHLQPTGGRA